MAITQPQSMTAPQWFPVSQKPRPHQAVWVATKDTRKMRASFTQYGTPEWQFVNDTTGPVYDVIAWTPDMAPSYCPPDADKATKTRQWMESFRNYCDESNIAFFGVHIDLDQPKHDRTFITETRIADDWDGAAALLVAIQQAYEILLGVYRNTVTEDDGLTLNTEAMPQVDMEIV